MTEQGAALKYRGGKTRQKSEADKVEARRQGALKLEKQLEKKKYSRPVDAECVDDISALFTEMGVKEKWLPVGTSSVKFSPSFGTVAEGNGEMDRVVATQLQCITGMKRYDVKSLEELRLEDHLAGYRYRGEPTGRFLFKKSKMKSRDLNYEWAQTGTLEVAFESVEDKEEDREGEMGVEHTTLSNCITAMDEYKHKSLEELRFEDYLSGLFALKKFGFNTQPSKNWYEDIKGLSVKHNGTGAPEFRACRGWQDETYLGSDVIMVDDGKPFGRTVEVTCEPNFQSITRISEYRTSSYEELRLVDYLSGLRGPRGPAFQASEEELMNLKVQKGMDVFIFIKLGPTEVREKGTIKYIGRVPDKAFGKLYVGLELDRPVGSGNGRFQDVRLFHAKQDHAKVVPLESVLPVALFEGFTDDESEMENEMDPESRQHSSGMFGNQNCVVCISRAVEIFLSQCGHACCCKECAERITSCPICRTKISGKQRVFLP